MSKVDTFFYGFFSGVLVMSVIVIMAVWLVVGR